MNSQLAGDSPNSCECMSNYYTSATDPLICSECHDDCNTCNGGTSSDCKSCAADNTELLSSPGACSCVKGWYSSWTNPLKCSQCHDDCSTCNGDTSSDC